MRIVIRRMLPSDAAPVYELLQKWNMAPVQASHEVPDPERSSIDVHNSFVAVHGERIVGVSSYIVHSATEAETASLAVDPQYLGAGIGYRLQRARLKEMLARGIKTVRTETDRLQTVRWYIDKFGYQIVGMNKKKHAFSLKDVDYWNVLELDLDGYAFREKLIINVAPTGVVPTKEDNPFVPLTPREIAADAKRVYDLGASIIHLHARDEHGRPTQRKEVFQEIIGRIREKCEDLIIVVSTSGRGGKGLEERMEALELDGPLRPDMASLTLGSMNFAADFSLNSPEAIATLLARMQACGIRPELEIFELGMANYAKFLVHRGILTGRLYANVLLGSLGTTAAHPKHLVGIVEELPAGLIWSATGVGRSAFPVQGLALVMGGHVRVGLEDSLYMDPDKEELATNEKLVARVVRLAEALGREVATPREVRAILGL